MRQKAAEDEAALAKELASIWADQTKMQKLRPEIEKLGGNWLNYFPNIEIEPDKQTMRFQIAFKMDDTYNGLIDVKRRGESIDLALYLMSQICPRR